MKYKALFETITIGGRVLPASDVFQTDADVEAFLAKNPHCIAIFANANESEISGEGLGVAGSTQPDPGQSSDSGTYTAESDDADADL